MVELFALALVGVVITSRILLLSVELVSGTTRPDSSQSRRLPDERARLS
jgi:hypothetical protein